MVAFQDLKTTNCYHYSVTTVWILNIENISRVTEQSSNAWMSLRAWVNYQHCLVQSDLFLIFLIFRGHGRILVGFTTTCAISDYHNWCYEFESQSGRGVQHYVIKFVSDMWQVSGFLFSQGPSVSSTNKTDRHDITDIL